MGDSKRTIWVGCDLVFEGAIPNLIFLIESEPEWEPDSILGSLDLKKSANDVSTGGIGVVLSELTILVLLLGHKLNQWPCLDYVQLLFSLA
jgi:hypothetical protein